MNDIKRIILASRFKEYEYMTGEPIKKRIIKTVNSLNNLSKEVKNSFIEAINIKEINNPNISIQSIAEITDTVTKSMRDDSQKIALTKDVMIYSILSSTLESKEKGRYIKEVIGKLNTCSQNLPNNPQTKNQGRSQ